MQFTPISAAIGGALIGLSAALLLRFNGRIAGISGIVNAAITKKPGDRLWRWLFLIGLISGGFVYQTIVGVSLVTREDFHWPLLIGAGLLVGFGTRLGSGCTSGHGVCGIARLSPRSVIATVVFLLTGMLTASVVFWIGTGV